MNRRITSLFLLAALGASAGLANGQDQKDKPKRLARPRLQIEEIKNAPWAVTVSVDKADRTYQLGDEVIIKVKSEQDGYLYVFNQDAAGNIVCLLPNKVQSKNEIKAGQEITVPDASDKFRIKAADPAGKEKIFAVVTKQPSPAMKLEDYTRGGPTKVKEANFRRLIVVAMGGNAQDVQDDKAGQQSAPPAQNQGSQDDPFQKEKEKISKEKPEQFEQKMKEWATANVEITTVAGKSKNKKDQD